MSILYLFFLIYSSCCIIYRLSMFPSPSLCFRLYRSGPLNMLSLLYMFTPSLFLLSFVYVYLNLRRRRNHYFHRCNKEKVITIAKGQDCLCRTYDNSFSIVFLTTQRNGSTHYLNRCFFTSFTVSPHMNKIKKHTNLNLSRLQLRRPPIRQEASDYHTAVYLV